jgi:hypothetical protein
MENVNKTRARSAGVLMEGYWRVRGRCRWKRVKSMRQVDVWWARQSVRSNLTDNVLVIRRIHLRLILQAEDTHRAVAARVHAILADKCPVYRSLEPWITMTTELVFEWTQDAHSLDDALHDCYGGEWRART